MTSPLRSIIVVAGDHDNDNAPELRCHDHPDWWADADAESLPTVIQRATEHIREDHRVHVPDCMCSGTQVIDQRCIPRIGWAEVAR